MPCVSKVARDTRLAQRKKLRGQTASYSLSPECSCSRVVVADVVVVVVVEGEGLVRGEVRGGVVAVVEGLVVVVDW